MANIAQATLIGADLVIRCDDRWDCCQRAQARAKAQAWNANLPGNGIQETVSKEDAAIKAATQRKATAAYDKLDGPGQGEKAVEDGAPECVEEKMAGPPPKTRKQLKYQMDHPLDVKAGGDPAAMLTPIDRHVNRAFGSFAKNAGNELLDQGETEIASVSLVCPASEPGCPDENHNAGKKRKYPEEPEYETTYEAKKGKTKLV
jgi:hypothetical protein